MSLILRAVLSILITSLCFIGVAHQASTVRHTLPSATQVQIHCACPSAS